MTVRIKNNYLTTNNKKYRCSIGRNGFSNNKKEGDGCTPVGVFNITEIYYREDKIDQLITNFQPKKILPIYGWCDDPENIKYNTEIEFPFSSSAEKLFRNDTLYDIICVINYNRDPIIASKGSAIFMHIASHDYSTTEGCIVLSKDDLKEILLTINKDTKIEIGL